MKFWKPIIFPCLLASRIISTDAAFIKGSSVKTLEDTVECPRSGSSFSSQYNLFSHNNDLPPSMEKHSQVEQSNALLAKYQDTAPIAMSSKRSFNNAFGNGEGEPANIPHIMNEPYFSPPFSANRGDDLMLFSTERDIFPTYTTELLSPEILCDYATALEGSEHSYCDYGYLQNNFLWENNNWLISQPEHIGDLSGINSRGAAETEHQSLGYSSMPVDLPLNTLIGTETTAGLGGNSFSSLENKLRVTIEGETSKLDGDDQSSAMIFETPNSFHFKNDPIRSQKAKTTKTKKTKKQVIRGQEKSLKDVLGEYKLKLEDLSKSGPNKSPLGLLLETMDHYADNKLTDRDHMSKKGINNYENKIYSRKTFIKLFLSQSGILICESQFNELQKSYKFRNDKARVDFNLFFYKLVTDQIERNANDKFYIASHQAEDFFNLKNYHYKINKSASEKEKRDKSFYADQIGKTVGKAIVYLPWKDISISDNNVEVFEKRESHLKDKRIGRFGVEHRIILNQRFNLRKFFTLYSTLINKVFCSGEKDLLENFLSRQRGAMSFFDEVLRLLEIDPKGKGKYFIRNENLPLDEEIKMIFFNFSSLTFPGKKFEITLSERNRSKIDVTWKFIALWLAKEKYDYYKEIYCSKNSILLHFRNFFNTFLFYILEG